MTSTASARTTVLISENMGPRMPGLADEFPEVDFIELPLTGGEMRPEYATAHAMFRSAMSEELFDEILRAAPDLRWIQISAAGFDWMSGDELAARVADGLVLTRSESSLNVTMAEYVLGAMLSAARCMPQFRDAQSRREWVSIMGRDFNGSTVAIFGTGAIGGEVAWRSSALGARVIGVNRTGHAQEHFEEVVARDEFMSVLPEADYVVLAMPLTPETNQMFGAAQFAAMKPSAVLVNVGRGALTDEDALVAALESDAIAGAVIDVFVEEPLPADSAMWSAKNLIATPHTSYRSEGVTPRLRNDFVSNLRRFLDGDPLAGRMKEPTLGY